jgi:phosphohistidine phosphatase
MIYLIRHGKSEDLITSDYDRRLTEEGKKELEENFKSFKKKFKSNNFKVYSSPYTRARQTADIFCSIFDCDYEILDQLSFGNSGYDKIVNMLDDDRDYILIGHQPYISDAIYRLTGRDVAVKRGSIHRVR